MLDSEVECLDYLVNGLEVFWLDFTKYRFNLAAIKYYLYLSQILK